MGKPSKKLRRKWRPMFTDIARTMNRINRSAAKARREDAAVQDDWLCELPADLEVVASKVEVDDQ